MRPFTANGHLWRVVGVSPDDPCLVDRTGTRRIATTDPSTRTICISDEVEPPLLDRVMVHEAAHAMTMSYGLLHSLHDIVPADMWVPVEEWSAELVEKYGIEAAAAASEALGRPVCVRGLCYDRP